MSSLQSPLFSPVLPQKAAVKTVFSVNWESFSALRRANGLCDLNRACSRLANSQSNFNFLFAQVDFLVLLQSEQVGEVNLKMKIPFHLEIKDDM